MPVRPSLLSRYALALLAASLLTSLPARADDPLTRALQASGRASAQAAGSVALGVSALGNATIAVSTVPLALAGTVLTAAGQASTAVAGSSLPGTVPVGLPLPITDEVITVRPPSAALAQPAAPAAPIG